MIASHHIREFFGLHPHEADEDAQTPPAVSLLAEGDAWTLYAHPQRFLTVEDRAWVWNELALIATVVLKEKMPELNCRIVTPAEFPDGTSVEGLVQFVCPPPASAAYQRYFWDRMSDEVPTISRLLAQQVERGWEAHRATHALGRASRRNRTTPPRPSTRGMRR